MKSIIQATILLAVIALIYGFTCASRQATPTEGINKKQRPNVIYIMADDMATQAISAYGGIYKDIAPTPNIDRLAAEGMLFENALCTNAICGPSRSAILTGDMSNLNGYYKNESGGQFDASKWTFPQAFQQGGYQTSLFGKWHLGSEPVGFDAFKFHANSGQQGTYWNPVYNHNGEKVKEKGYATNLSTDAALDWLQNDRATDQPFMMLLQYKAPHRPWEPDRKYEKIWDDIDMPYPTTFDDDYAGREATAGDTEMTMDYLSRRDMKLQRPEGLKGKERIKWDFYGAKAGQIVQPEGMTTEEGKRWRYQRYIKDYLACVKSVDDNIGRVLDYLKANGLEENTIIVLTSDQGFYLGEHGFFDKRFIYEQSIKMPLIVKYPGKVAAGKRNRDIVRNTDFAPTLLDVCGVKTQKEMQGESFATLLDGKTPKNWQQSMYYHYYEFPFWHHVQPHYGIRTQGYTLAHFYYSVDKWELYDLKKDPDQVNNCINDPAYKDTIAQLKAQLADLQKQYGDDLTLDEYRAISDKDFGHIVKNENESERVEGIINGNAKKSKSKK